MHWTIELPTREEQLQLNRNRWKEILSDAQLAQLEYRIETNAHGQILMTPPASGGHSRRQGEIAFQLRQLLGGRTLPECPLSTVDGVKAVDVGWYSDDRFETVNGQSVFETAPEICVEVLSPSNTRSEMQNKRQLYFEAGADEVWICGVDGAMQFHQAGDPDVANDASLRCPTSSTKI